MITKAARDDEAFTKGLTFTKAARDAWELIINSVKEEQGYANILLPSYIGVTDREGSGIFDPVVSTESNYDFYDMTYDLGVDYKSLETLINTKKFNILLVVHYFGFCRNDLYRIKKLCEVNNVILVEDCAHAFQLGLTNENLGVLGDFSIYSIHKYLPVSSGGVLKNISNKIKLLELPDEDNIALIPALQLLNSDIEGIAKKRRRNYSLYEAKLLNVKGIDVMYSLGDSEVPQTFAIRVKNEMREPLYFYLIDKGMVTTALYYRLLDQLDSDTYSFVHDISDEILNLPVHQDTSEEDILGIINEIKKFLGN